MNGYYKYSRNKLIELIKKSPKTCDGYYCCFKFPEYNLKKGDINGEYDKNYYYKRELFKNKICFNEYEINCYLAKNKIGLDENKMQFIDDNLKNIIQDFNNIKLEDIIPNESYNLGELIDTSIFFFNSKY